MDYVRIGFFRKVEPQEHGGWSLLQSYYTEKELKPLVNGL